MAWDHCTTRRALMASRCSTVNVSGMYSRARSESPRAILFSAACSRCLRTVTQVRLPVKPGCQRVSSAWSHR